jgi:hypothetical protein
VSLKSILVGAVIFALGSAAPAFASEYLTNGSFETGDLTGSGWTLVGDPLNTGVVPPNYTFDGQGAPNGGGYFVITGALTSEGASLSQSFTDIPLETLTISGWISSDGNPATVTFSFDGNVLLTINPGQQIWTQYTVTASASGNDTFSVGFANDFGQSALGDFSVSSVASVPEPSTWALLLIGFAGLGFFRYRTRDATFTA